MRERIAAGIRYVNEERPQQGLDNMCPTTYIIGTEGAKSGVSHHKLALTELSAFFGPRLKSTMGVANWFITFCDTINVQNKVTISSRYKNITKRLNTDFWDTNSDSAHSLYVGSYGRNTAIDSTSDVDMIFRLPNSIYHRYNNYIWNGQSGLLQAVRNSVKTTYSATNIGADGQVILVYFTDGITFELVPGFLNNGGSYTYANSNGGGSWKTTNPKPEIEAIRTRNNECNGNLIRLCRMMRSWKVKWGVPINGLLIDTLAYQFIRDSQYRDKSYLYYDYLCRDFFAYMAGQSADQKYWTAPGSGQRVYGGNFQYKAKRCFNIALQAIKHETANPKQEWSAKQRWREIFGTSFPN